MNPASTNSPTNNKKQELPLQHVISAELYDVVFLLRANECSLCLQVAVMNILMLSRDP
jgi:hypothetical protein